MNNNDYYKSLEPFWGSWRICDFIGEGSYGKVFKIEKKDISGNYYAAMKVLSIRQSGDMVESVRGIDNSASNYSEHYRLLAQNMANEFKLMEQLKGTSNIVCYEDHEIREYNDGCDFDIFIRMELLTPVNEFFKQNTPSEADIIRLGIDICKALETCAKHDILHRDVKPGNVFVSNDGNYKLGDFGVARTMEKANTEFSKKGTYDYMAPEVYKGEAYGPGADIFSLGIVLYKYMNNGRIPFLPPITEPIKPNSMDEALSKRLKCEDVPAPCNASGEFGRIISKACAGDVHKRYQSAKDLRKDLEKILNKVAVLPQDDATIVMGSAPVEKSKNKGLLFILLALVAAMIIGVAAALVIPGLLKKDDEETIDASTENTEVIEIEEPELVVEVVETWEVTDYEENYPFYAIETKYLDGVATEETRVNEEITKYMDEDARIYYFEGSDEETAKRILYINGTPFDYVEFVDNLSEEEWVVEGCDSEYREYARKYVNGEKTEETEYTGVYYDSYIYIASDGCLFNTVYSNGKALSYVPVEELGSDVWVVDGKIYEDDTYNEIAVRYIDGVPTEETKLTGRVYDTFVYTFKNTEDDGMGNYYRVLYVNGQPTDNKEYVNALAKEEWIVAGYDEYYQEYAVLYKDGFADDETRYTGRTVYVETWVKEKDKKYSFERKYINGQPTEEIRKKKKLSTKKKTTSSESTETTTPVVQAPAQTPVVQAPAQTPVVQAPAQTPVVQAPVVQQPQAPVVAYTREVLDKSKYAWYLVRYDSNGKEISRSYLRAAYHKQDSNGTDIWW